jgi:transposase InsO family protein
MPTRSVDNGHEFILKELDKWAYENKATLDFSRPDLTPNEYLEKQDTRNSLFSPILACMVLG